MKKDELRELRRKLKELQEYIEVAVEADKPTDGNIMLATMQGQLICHLNEASHLIHAFWQLAN